MRKIFIADAHLRDPKDHNYLKLIAFLNHLPEDTDTLFILGDLFEFWVGYPPDSFPHYIPLLNELEKLHARGVEIMYFEGNHDFNLGQFFEQNLRARVYRDGAILTIDGKNVYLCHGDEINRTDYGYRAMRWVFHSGVVRALTRVVPASYASWIAATLGSGSRSRHQARKVRWDFAGMLREFAAEKFRAGCDVVIAGHFHIPLLEKWRDGEVLLCLGDWITHFTYGEWCDGSIELKQYQE